MWVGATILVYCARALVWDMCSCMRTTFKFNHLCRHPWACVHTRKTHRHTAHKKHIKSTYMSNTNKTKFTKQWGEFCRSCTISNDHYISDHLAVELPIEPQSTALSAKATKGATHSTMTQQIVERDQRRTTYDHLAVTEDCLTTHKTPDKDKKTADIHRNQFHLELR